MGYTGKRAGEICAAVQFVPRAPAQEDIDPIANVKDVEATVRASSRQMAGRGEKSAARLEKKTSGMSAGRWWLNHCTRLSLGKHGIRASWLHSICAPRLRCGECKPDGFMG